MKKIIVMSDTHGYIDNALKVLDKNSDADIVIHLGDYFRDALRLKANYPKMNFEYVCGNCDFMVGDVPAEKIIVVEGKKILITHGHKYSVKWGYEKLKKKAEKEDIDILLFGHTHIASLEYSGRHIFLNPGSLTDSRGKEEESYAILNIDNDKIEAKIKQR